MPVASTPSVLLLDPWAPDYDSPVQIEAAGDAAARVDTGVEGVAWEAVTPAEKPARTLYFLDGVRRIEARVMAWRDGRIVHGLFGSLAAGLVRVCEGRACVEKIVNSRHLVLGAGLHHGVAVRPDVTFEAYSTPENGPAEMVNALQNLMRDTEAKLGESVADPGSCVFVDGPLTYFSAAAQPFVGVIKKIYEPYLDPEKFALVPQLAAGARTPLFAIRDGKYDRYSWFLRIASGRRIDHPLAGIVRLEVRAAVGIDAARELASLSAACLPQFASSTHRDPRAPQNLLPVGALEEQLRRRLGDAVLIRRAIEAKLSEGVSI
jgi:hypothetical protein